MHSFWQIHQKNFGEPYEQGLPEVILTETAGELEAFLPPELELLLPNKSATANWVIELLKTDASQKQNCLGIFMADPLLPMNQIIQSIEKSAVKWVCNFPSVVQHDESFLDQLKEVGLGFHKEVEQLKKFEDAGCKCIVSVSSADEAKLASKHGFETFLMLPKMRMYEAGFPSALTRRQTAEEIADTVSEQCRLIMPATGTEVLSQSLWPQCVGAVLERPNSLTSD